MRNNRMCNRAQRTARLLAALALAALLLALQAGACFADTADAGSTKSTGEYGYTIRIYTGNQGTFADGSTELKIPAAAGDSVTLDAEALGITVTNDKYYLKGLRPAGYDSNDATVIKTRTLTANEDQAYVAVYGVKGNTVKYTVNYVDADGQQLLPPSEYYGAAGDKPVVSYKYVEGYQPTAYNETKTLTDNEAENVFTFRYRAVAAGTESAAAGAGTTDNGGTAGTAGTGTTGAGTTGAGTTADAGTTGAGTTGNGAADQNAQPADQQTAPADLVDLDNEDLPLADNPGGNDADADATEEVEDSQLPLSGPAIAGIAAGSIGILGLIIYLLTRRKAAEAADPADKE